MSDLGKMLIIGAEIAMIWFPGPICRRSVTVGWKVRRWAERRSGARSGRRATSSQ